MADYKDVEKKKNHQILGICIQRVCAIMSGIGCNCPAKVRQHKNIKKYIYICECPCCATVDQHIERYFFVNFFQKSGQIIQIYALCSIPYLF